MTADNKSLRFASKVVHAGQRPDPSTGAVMPPIYATTTYAQKSPGVHQGYDYARVQNPTRYALERMMSGLEGGALTEEEDPGCGGFAFVSGMAAISCLLELIPSGARVAAMDDLYGGMNRLLNQVRDFSQALRIEHIDMSDPSKLEDGLRADTKLVWIETPTNPTLKLVDLKKTSEIVRKTAPDALLCCDNTFASPLNQNPFAFGFDVVMHSTTKYLNGHSDALGGVLVVRDKGLAEKLRFVQKSVGSAIGPFDAFLTLRGIKTLDVRMNRHNESGLRIAQFLEQHAAVERVLYPGLPSHPQHELARRQMCGHTGMITIYLAGGIDAARRMLEKVRLFTLAESLGGVESLIEHPAIMTHASVSPEMRAELGISDSLVRLSVGVEDPDDLIADLEQALA